MAWRVTGVTVAYRGRKRVYNALAYSGIYAQDRGGAFFVACIYSDFIGVNGRFFKNVYKST